MERKKEAIYYLLKRKEEVKAAVGKKEAAKPVEEKKEEIKPTEEKKEEVKKKEKVKAAPLSKAAKEILAAIDKMTVIELSGLVKALEEKFKVSAQVMSPSAAAVGGGASSKGGAPAEEKTEFNVVLVSPGSQKIPVIKVVREITGLGLKEAKDLVDGTPKPIKENVPKEQAEEIKKKLTDTGATVELK